MIKDRLIDLINSFGEPERKKYIHFQELTGVKKDTLKNLCRGQQRVNEEHITLITDAFPQYKMWLVFGETAPEIGQISPEVNEISDNLKGTGTDT